MKELKKLSRDEMRKVRGGVDAPASCFAGCGNGVLLQCGGGTGPCIAVEGVGCNSQGGGNAQICSGVIPPVF